MNRIRTIHTTRTIRDGHRDKGQVALEYIGFLPILLLVGLGGIQLGWSAYVVQQAQTAARTAARVEAREPGEGEQAGLAAITPSLVAGAVVDVNKTPDAVRATVRLTIESILPGMADRSVIRTAVMPNDDPR